jgi:dipeptidase
VCDTVVVVHDDRVWFAKNSDRDANEAQLLEWHPAAAHPAGTQLRCTHVTVPQVARTHAVLLSRPFWMWGAEMGTNAHGLTIGNEAVFATGGAAATGLTGMDLLRLALERAGTVDEAIEVIVTLLDRHGQGGRCGFEDPSFRYDSSFLLADPSGAAVLETAGTRWAVERVGHGVRSISNGYSIEEFAAAHADRLRERVAACEVRAARTAALARPDLAGMAALLRDHGRGRVGPRYRPHHGAMTAPCAHGGGLLAATQTTASWVSELAPNGVRHLATGTAAPCTSIMLPVEVDRPLPLGPDPDGRADADSWWWQHERVHRRAIRDPQRWLPRLARDRQALESRVLRGEVAGAQAVGEVRQVRQRWSGWLDAAPPRDVRPVYVRRYWGDRDRRAGLRPEVVTTG